MLRSLLTPTLDSEPWKPTPRDSHYIRRCSNQGRPAAGAQRRVLVRDAIRNVVLKPRTAGPVAIWDGERERSPSITIASTISPDAAREAVFVERAGQDHRRQP